MCKVCTAVRGESWQRKGGVSFHRCGGQAGALSGGDIRDGTEFLSKDVPGRGRRRGPEVGMEAANLKTSSKISETEAG